MKLNAREMKINTFVALNVICSNRLFQKKKKKNRVLFYWFISQSRDLEINRLCNVRFDGRHA